MLDIKGPRIITGMLTDNEPIEIEAGQSIEIHVDTENEQEGDNTKIYCNYEALCSTV